MSDIIQDAEDARLLTLVQSTRETIVKALVKDGKPPEDAEGRAFLTQTLNGLAGTILGKAKIKVDAAAARSNAASAQLVAQALLKYNPNRPTSINGATLELPAMDTELLPGETDQGTRPIPYKEVMGIGE